MPTSSLRQQSTCLCDRDCIVCQWQHGFSVLASVLQGERAMHQSQRLMHYSTALQQPRRLEQERKFADRAKLAFSSLIALHLLPCFNCKGWRVQFPELLQKLPACRWERITSPVIKFLTQWIAMVGFHLGNACAVYIKGWLLCGLHHVKTGPAYLRSFRKVV